MCDFRRDPSFGGCQLVRLLVVALLLGTSARALDAQALRITAVEEGTGAVLAGALVDVLDASDAVAAQGVLGADGRRLVAAPYVRSHPSTRSNP